MITDVYSIIYMMETFIAILIIKQFILLESENEQQKKITRVFIIVAAAISACAIAFSVFGHNIKYYDSFINIYKVVISATMYLSVTISSFSIREKYKYHAFLIIIPLIGYIDVMTYSFQIIYVAIAGKRSDDLFEVILITCLLILFAVLCKTNPKSFAKYRKDIHKYQLTNLNRVIIWLVGVWLFAYDLWISYREDAISNDAFIVCTLSTTILAFMIIKIVATSIQNQYYYNVNLDMQKNLIGVMADLVENRDESTGGHIQRTARYTEILAESLCESGLHKDILTPEYIRSMVIAAPLHDIGKISIPDNVLKKPSKLTDEEYETVKTHSAQGSIIINRVEATVGETDYLSIAQEMARSHHERWDGKGYPDRLAGTDIPLCARILSVADVFDALLSKRCYKNAMTFDDACKIIGEGSGTQFDPDVVDAFFNALPDIKSVTKEFRD